MNFNDYLPYLLAVPCILLPFFAVRRIRIHYPKAYSALWTAGLVAGMLVMEFVSARLFFSMLAALGATAMAIWWGRSSLPDDPSAARYFRLILAAEAVTLIFFWSAGVITGLQMVEFILFPTHNQLPLWGTFYLASLAVPLFTIAVWISAALFLTASLFVLWCRQTKLSRN